jgi:drug/metabolite transporter (DMT)-like permease
MPQRRIADLSTFPAVMTPRDWAMLGLLALIWAGSFLFVAVAVAELPPLTIVLTRVALGALCLNLALPALGLAMPRDPRLWRDFMILGAINNVVPFGLITWGQTEIGAGLAAILNATTPMFAVLVTRLFTNDPPGGRHRLAGLVVGFAGVVVMIGPAALSGLKAGLLGQLAVVGAAVSYAIAGLHMRRLKGEPAMRVACGQVTASTLIMAVLVAVIDQPWTLALPSATVLGALAALGVVSTAVAYYLYFAVMQRAGAVNASLVTFLIPPVAVLLGVLVLDERLDPRQVAGMALIMAGLVVLDGRMLHQR